MQKVILRELITLFVERTDVEEAFTINTSPLNSHSCDADNMNIRPIKSVIRGKRHRLACGTTYETHIVFTA